MKCKNCQIEEAIKYGKYSSGEFCSRKCACSFSTKEKRKEINEKVSIKIKSLKPKREDVVKTCKICFNEFKRSWRLRHTIYCSKSCMMSDEDVLKKLSENSKKRCDNINEKIRMREIGRKGGFGKKGYTTGGNYFQSTLEQKCFEFLEERKIEFIPHKSLPDSSKDTDIYLVKENIWIELDGIDREKKKKWIGKDYEYWINKLEEYKQKNLNFIVFKKFEEFKNFILKDNGISL